MVFVHLGAAGDGQRFFDEFWPDAAAIPDPECRLYGLFGLGRASLRQMLGLDVWRAGLRALGKGDGVGLPVGDPWVMPGMFLIDATAVLWSHDYAHAGDVPDLAAVLRVLAAR